MNSYKLKKLCIMKTLLVYTTLLLTLWLSSDISWAKTIIETLPGFPGKLPFKLETGYIGLGELESKQTFYYFFESERNPKDDPLLLFLTGGPGCSGLGTAMLEMGPFTVDETISINASSIPTLKLKPYSWTKLSNLLVIDQPVGTGYSYGKATGDYKTNDTQSAHLIYQFVKKWLIIHPEYLNNPLYIGGDSYTGIWVPLVVKELYDGNEAQGDTPLNIKGYVLGNALTDKYNDLNNRVKYAHRMGLLSDSLYQSAKSNCKGNYRIIDQNNVLCKTDMQRISECLYKICFTHILFPINCDEWAKIERISSNLLLPSSQQLNTMSDVQLTATIKYTLCGVWANHKSVHKALRIDKGTIRDWPAVCNETMRYTGYSERTETYEFDVQSTVPVHKYLTSKRARALIYSGDHDMHFSHVSTEEWIDSLRLKVESEWRPWLVQGEVAGYTVKYSHLEYELTYATIKGGAHVAIESNPKECFNMINRWLASDPM